MGLNQKIRSNFIYNRLKRVYLYCRYLRDFLHFKALDKRRRFGLSWGDRYPALMDKTATTGFDRHYLYHTAWAARKVAEIRPEFHIDISSSLYFSALVSAFVPVRFYDYRPADIQLSDLMSERADLMHLPFADNSVRALSCMHVVEHIGLGRYGDPIDPEGDLKAIKELKRVLAPGGSLLFVVPVGKPRIQFNAHRVYAYEQIMEYFSDLHLKEFALIPQEAGPIEYGAAAQRVAQEAYACGCFWFTK